MEEDYSEMVERCRFVHDSQTGTEKLPDESSDRLTKRLETADGPRESQ